MHASGILARREQSVDPGATRGVDHHAALTRTESRGSHYRSDFPAKNDATWLKNICLSRTSDGNLFEEAQEVSLTRLTPGEMPAELRAPTAAAAAR